MARGGDLNVALRIAADVANGVQGLRQVEGAVDKTSNAIANLTRLAAAYVSLRTLQHLGGLADAYGQNADRIRNATASTEDYNKVQERLLKTANGTYRALGEAQEVFLGTSRTLQALGYSVDEVLDISDSLSYAFVRDAATADRARGAMDAYSKSLAKGKIDADAWASIIAASPTIIDNVAKATGRTGLEIQKLGAEGKLSLQALNEGLRQSLVENQTAAEGMSVSNRDATVQMGNALTVFAGKVNEATGASNIFTENVGALASLLQDPATINAAVTMATGIVGALNKIIEGFHTTVEVVKWAGEEIAATLNGASGDDAVRLEDDLAAWQKMLDNPLRRWGFKDGIPTIFNEAEIKAQIDRVNALLAGAYKAQEDMARQRSGKPAPAIAAPTAPKIVPAEARNDEEAAAKQANVYAQQQLALKKQIETSTGKLREIESGVAAETRQASEALKFWLDGNKEALRLQPAQIANLTKMAEQADRMAEAVRQASVVQGLQRRAQSVGQTEAQSLQAEIERAGLSPEKLAQAQAAAAEYLQKKDAETLKQLSMQALAASGDSVAAQAAQMEQQFGELMTRLKARGDEAGVAIVQKLIDVSAAKAELDKLQKEVDTALADQARRQADLDLRTTTGAISKPAAQRELVAINQDTAQRLAETLPRMRELAAITGDEGIARGVELLADKIKQLEVDTNSLGQAFGDAFESSLANTLSQLGTEITSIEDAARSLLNSLATGLQQWAAEGLASSARAGLTNLISGKPETDSTTPGAGARTAADSSAASATTALATAANAAAMALGQMGTAAGGSAAVGAVGQASPAADAAESATAQTEAQTTAAASAGQLASSMASAAGASQQTSGIFGMLVQTVQAVIAAMMAAKAAEESAATAKAIGSAFRVAAATGGHITGPGTGTSDSIPAMLSNGEFVARAAVVAQPGARQFLHAFNQYGMAALNMVPRFADGGLVGVSPSVSRDMPAYKVAEAPAAAGGSTSLGVFNYFDLDQLSQALATHRGFEKTVVNIASANGGTIRRSWQR